MGSLANTPVERLTGLIWGLLLAAICAQLWFSSTPLPWGGPNVIVAGAAVLLSLVYALLRIVARPPLATGPAALFRELRPLLPTLAVSALLTLWAFLIHRFNNNLEAVRLAQMILGVGVLFAMYLAVERESRARLIILTLIAATSVASLFGLAVVWIGDPFLTFWLRFSSVREIDLETILTYGRTAGLAAHTASFSYQLAAAVPLAFAAILYYAPFAGGRRAKAYSIGMFLMLAVLTTALVVNGTRAAMLGALVAFAIIAFPALRLPPLRRRLAYTVPLLAAWLMAFFNPMFTVNNLVSEVAAAGQEGGYGLPRSRSDFEGLVAGLDGLEQREHRPVSGYRVAGVVSGQEYTAQLRARSADGALWQGNDITARAEADGSFLLTWYTPEVLNLGSYQLRLRPGGDRRWQPWRDFTPRSYGSVLPPIELLSPSQAAPEEGRQVLRHSVENLIPGVEYVAQMRAQGKDQYSEASPGVVLRASPQGRLALSWREPVAAGRISEYQYRLQRRDLGQWEPWQDVTAGGQINWADFANLTGSVDGLADTSEGPVIGHMFEAVSFRYNYFAQLRPRLGESFGAASEEVIVRPWQEGEFALTWRASTDPAITGYQYRFRRFSVEEWLPWRDFAPTLSSAGPVLTAVAGDRADVVSIANRPVIRHTIGGFIPGLEYQIQLRARNRYGYGRSSNEVTATAAADGALTLAWAQPANPESITGYQFRQWTPVNLRWLHWQDFDPELGVPGGGAALAQSPAEVPPAEVPPAEVPPAEVPPAEVPPAEVPDAQEIRIEAARLARDQAPTQTEDTAGSRLFIVSSWWVQLRTCQLIAAWRYFLDNPMGTGIYSPDRSHICAEVEPVMAEHLLRHWPHNQFLHILVIYGVPGLLLLSLFYALVGRALYSAIRRIMAAGDSNLHFLGVAVVGAFVAYTIATLLTPLGPFIIDWGHFFVLGLVFSLQRITAGLAEGAEPGNTAPPPRLDRERTPGGSPGPDLPG